MCSPSVDQVVLAWDEKMEEERNQVASSRATGRFPIMYTWTGLLATPVNGDKKCETGECSRMCLLGERFCMKCRNRLFRRMRDDNYLQPVPRSVRRHSGGRNPFSPYFEGAER